MSDIANIESWKEISKGYYRYVIAAGACYEIIFNYSDDDTNTTASLYITGDWISEDTGEKFFSRELLTEGTLKECLEIAKEDYEQNIIHWLF